VIYERTCVGFMAVMCHEADPPGKQPWLAAYCVCVEAVAWVPGDAKSISKLPLVSIPRLIILIPTALPKLLVKEIGPGTALLPPFC